MQRRDAMMAMAAAMLGLGGCGGGTAAGWAGRLRTLGVLRVSGHASAPGPDGGMFVIGGDRAGSTLSDAIDRIDPVDGSVRRVALLSSGRVSHTATTLSDGSILIVGGVIALVGAPGTEWFDPLQGQVQPLPSPVLPRVGHTATRLANDRILLIGGVGRDSAELWEPATRRWRLLPSRMRHTRSGHTATVLDDGRVLVVGGDAAGVAPYTAAELWTPMTEAFEPVDSGALEPRLLHAAWRAGDGTVMVVGGEDTSATQVTPLASAWRFDPRQGRITAVASLRHPRTAAACIGFEDGSALLIGGQTPEDPASARIDLWHPRHGEQALARMAQPRRWHTADLTAGGQVLIVGGEAQGGGLAAPIELLS